jgi:FlaG/FlaF family flagellin (archaellin)
MKFGVREICEVVLKAKAAMKVGNKVFYANEPVIYFDTLKTSSMEGAATTVYANGGRGNARLVAWEGERTVTFTMEDALISPEGFMILSGAGLIDASKNTPVYQHVTETIDQEDVTITGQEIKIPLSQKPYLPTDKLGNYAYVMLMKNGEVVSEPYIPEHNDEIVDDSESGKYNIVIKAHTIYDDVNKEYESVDYNFNKKLNEEGEETNEFVIPEKGIDFDSVLVDYYVAHESDAQQIEITADKFGGNYYLEASTLFRNQNGVDMPAEFIIPNCKIIIYSAILGIFKNI